MINLYTGWLSPMGELIEVDNGDHIAEAYAIAAKYQYHTTVGKSIDDVLMDNGWVHITRGMFLDHDYHLYWNGHLTPEAFAVMREWFENPDTVKWINKWTIDSWEMEVKMR